MLDQPRPVWLTRQQRDSLESSADSYLPSYAWQHADNLTAIVAAWDEAPGDTAALSEIRAALRTLEHVLPPGVYDQLHAQTSDWPMPRDAPTTPPDDEALEVPDE